MFTGLVECTGIVSSFAKQRDGWRLDINPSQLLETKIGDSIAINGCCLTVADHGVASSLLFDVAEETHRITTLGTLQAGRIVNLERALLPTSRLGGHIVQGHVDGIAHVVQIVKDPNGWHLSVSLPQEFAKFLVTKGSICLDGVSLTVNQITDTDDACLISLMLIPTTISETHFAGLCEKQALNFEVDILAKHLDRLSLFYRTKSL